MSFHLHFSRRPLNIALCFASAILAFHYTLALEGYGVAAIGQR